MSHPFAAVDLSPEGGRVLVGRIAGDRLELHPIHRFANRVLRMEGTLRWDLQRLYGEVLAALGMAARAFPGLGSVAIDAWGADFGLLDARGQLLGAPFHHGDRRTEGIPARLHARLPEEELWAATGLRSRPSNTLYQLHAMALRRSSTLTRAARLLLLPDLLAHWLCGAHVAEHTAASTTQCYDLATRTWVTPLLVQARIPALLFPPVVPPATALGPLLSAPARRAGLNGVQVVAPAAHHTASALAAIPVYTSSAAYVRVSSASHVGAWVAAPVRTEKARLLGLTHLGGVDGTFHLHRRAAGLGLVQACRRAWARDGVALDDAALAALAAAGTPFTAAVDVEDPSLLEPADVVAAVADRCAATGQSPPETRADLLRVLLESLAWAYRRTVRDLEALLGRRLEVVHLAGEGAANALLCQLTADACGRRVLAGPVEATALGNVLAQAIATGACASWGQARALVRASFPPIAYEPQDAAAWDEASARIEPILARARAG